MITQNKGEWSELYVFLKLLGDGVLYAADADLNKIENLYYPLIEILRKENDQIKHYVNNDTNIKIVDENGNKLLNLPAVEFEMKARALLNAIKESKSTFSIPDIENFMKVIKCSKVKADSMDKSDITLVLHDNKTQRDDAFGFSIKSRLGSPSTLLNAGKPTNFTYEIVGNLSDNQVKEINVINTHSKIQDRIKRIRSYGGNLKFNEVENENFKANLQMVDVTLPLIMSEFLLQYYIGNGKTVYELTPLVRKVNPCHLNIKLPHMFYEHKMKAFLTDCALGMTAANPWNGKFQATGGYIIVREDGEVLCYHVYNHNEFQNYLFKNTRFETPSTTRYDFGHIYKKNDKNYIKLNLQVRFI